MNESHDENQPPFGADDIHAAFYSHLTDETVVLDKTPLPYYIEKMFASKNYPIEIPKNEGGEGRENWDSQIEYLLSCIGYAVGLGNLWRFPAKVYQGGGGVFLIPYILFCITFAGPLMILEMSIGQFSGFGCSRTFELCPILFGIGWAIGINTFFIMADYTVVITWCLLYLKSSFESPLPWSLCSHSFNTPACLNLTVNSTNFNSSNFELSTIEFWDYYVTGDKKPDGTYYKITEFLGFPNFTMSLFLILVILSACLSVIDGVKVTGKIVYVTVLFPYVIIFQFIVLGCTLPGALQGIKYYLYPDVKKLLEPSLYISALEQLFFSCGIATGGIITMSSFNRFRDNIYRNVFIVIFSDMATSFIGGFATFPVLGYMSYKSGRHIKDIVKDDVSLFFITYPEALSTISGSNLWTVLFMLMALFLGFDSLFVLLDTVTVNIFDNWRKFQSKKVRKVLTLIVGIITFLISGFFILPGGLNWMTLYDEKVLGLMMIFSAIMECFAVIGIYGMKRFQRDFKLMTGKSLNIFWIILFYTILPIGSVIIFVMFILNSQKVIVRNNISFPMWTIIIEVVLDFVFISPIIIGMIIILITYRRDNPKLSMKEYLKLCVKPPPYWGPASKRYWLQSEYYSKKLVKYKDHPLLLKSLLKDESIETLLQKVEKHYLQA